MEKEFEKSSGNVFTDLGFPESEQELVKAKLTVQIYRLIKKQGLSQTDAAQLLGTTQPQISALMRCRPTSISIGRLMEFLTILGQDIEVMIKPVKNARGKKRRGHMSVALVESAI
jgi:predicted XRE-type DNA-binding protein